MTGAVQLELAVPADHPTFSGHFPGAPVLPGVVLLAEVIDAVHARSGLRPASAGGDAVLTVDHVKWLAPVGPGDRLVLALAARGDGVDFDVSRDDTPVARGRISWQPR